MEFKGEIKVFRIRVIWRVLWSMSFLLVVPVLAILGPERSGSYYVVSLKVFMSVAAFYAIHSLFFKVTADEEKLVVGLLGKKNLLFYNEMSGICRKRFQGLLIKFIGMDLFIEGDLACNGEALFDFLKKKISNNSSDVDPVENTFAVPLYRLQVMFIAVATVLLGIVGFIAKDSLSFAIFCAVVISLSLFMVWIKFKKELKQSAIVSRKDDFTLFNGTYPIVETRKYAQVKAMKLKWNSVVVSCEGSKDMAFGKKSFKCDGEYFEDYLARKTGKGYLITG